MNDYLTRNVAFTCFGGSRTPKRRAITLVELLVVIAICVMLVALMLPAVRSAREPARRMQCSNNLKQISLALMNYSDTHGTLPPASTTDANGNPLHSWRTLILPYLESSRLYESIDLTNPWDHPVNAEPVETTMPVYQCPSRAELDNRTTYLAVLAPNSCFPATEPRDISDITGPHSQTMTVIEVNAIYSVPWMSPFDADEQLVMASRSPDSSPPHPGGRQAAFLDGSVHFLSVKITESSLRSLMSITDTVDKFQSED